MLQLFTAFKITFSVNSKPRVYTYGKYCMRVAALKLTKCCRDVAIKIVVYRTMRVVSKYTKLANGSYLEPDPLIFTEYLRVVHIINPDNIKTNLKHCTGSSNGAVTAPCLGYEASNLKLYDVVITLFLRTSQKTNVLYWQEVEHFNVKPGGTHCNHQALEEEYSFTRVLLEGLGFAYLGTPSCCRNQCLSTMFTNPATGYSSLPKYTAQFARPF